MEVRGTPVEDCIPHELLELAVHMYETTSTSIQQIAHCLNTREALKFNVKLEPEMLREEAKRACANDFWQQNRSSEVC